MPRLVYVTWLPDTKELVVKMRRLKLDVRSVPVKGKDGEVYQHTQWGVERIAELKPNQSISIRRFDFHFDGITQRQGPNYSELAAHFTVRKNGELIGIMEPAKRNFSARGTATSEAALMTRGFAQLYLSLGDPNPDGSVAVRLYYKPLVLLIWLGAVVMMIGGTLSLSDRRLRVGAPKPARGKPAMQPAE